MRIKGLSVLLSAVMVCSIITGCTGKDNTESKKVAESSSEATSKKEDSSSGEEKDSSSDQGEGALSKLKDIEKKAEEISDDIKDEQGSGEEREGKYHPGDVVTIGNFEITYKSIKKYKIDSEFLQPKKGFQYIKYEFSFKNTGKWDSFVGNFDCYADGEKCHGADVDGSNINLLYTELSAGRKKNGSLVYQVPKNVKLKDIELEYENNSLSSDEKIIFLGK